MAVPAADGSEDAMTILACVILVVMFIVTAASASLWFCNCCRRRTKPSRSRSNQYSLSMRSGCEFDNPQGAYLRNALTAQLSPTICVTPGSVGTLDRSISFEVCSEDPFAVSPSIDAASPTTPDVATSKAASLLASFKRRLASLGRKTRIVDADADADTSVDRELGASSMDGMLRKFDSLVLSVQWSDLTESEANHPDEGAADVAGVIELVKQGIDAPRPTKTLVLDGHVTADSCPALRSPDVFSFKSFGSDQSFYSIGDSTSELYRSCSYDGIPQSSRRSSYL